MTNIIETLGSLKGEMDVWDGVFTMGSTIIKNLQIYSSSSTFAKLFFRISKFSHFITQTKLKLLLFGVTDK